MVIVGAGAATTGRSVVTVTVSAGGAGVLEHPETIVPRAITVIHPLSAMRVPPQQAEARVVE